MVTQSIDFKRSPTLVFLRDRAQQAEAATDRLLDKIEAQNRFDEAQRVKREEIRREKEGKMEEKVKEEEKKEEK